MAQKFIVVYEYEARYSDELNLLKDDIVILSISEENGWSEGKTEKGGKQGWFPTSFVSPLSSQNSAASIGASSSPSISHKGETKSPTLTKSKDDLIKKKKNRSLFTKSVKLSSEDIKRKHSDIKRESSFTSTFSTTSSISTSPSTSPVVPHKPSPPPLTSSHSISSIPQNQAIYAQSPLSSSGPVSIPRSSSLLSMNDAESESIVENMRKTSGYLGKWLTHRASKDKLKEKGIITLEDEKKTETVFGIPLDLILAEYGSPIPSFVKQSVEYLSAHSIEEEGIFRISGVASAVCNLGEAFYDKHAKVNFGEMDCHAVTGFLKKFFRELPEPLFTFEANDEFISTLSIENKNDRARQFKKIFNSLPMKNFEIITYLLKFLNKITTRSDINLMHANNLGVVFGPTLMRSKQDSLSGLMNPMSNNVGVIAACINDFDLIFGAEQSQQPPIPPAKPSPSPSSPQPTQPTQPMNRPPPLNRARSEAGSVTPPQLPSKATNKPSPPSRLSRPPERPRPTPPSTPPVAEEPKAELVRALYDYNGDPALHQLTFKAGEQIQVVLKHPSGWWTGVVAGKQGLFPMNFVQQ